MRIALLVLALLAIVFGVLYMKNLKSLPPEVIENQGQQIPEKEEVPETTPISSKAECEAVVASEPSEGISVECREDQLCFSDDNFRKCLLYSATSTQ